MNNLDLSSAFEDISFIDRRISDKEKHHDLDDDYKRLRNKSFEDDNNARKKCTVWSLRLVTGSIIIIFGIVFLQGFKLLDFCLSDKVLMTLLATTMTEIISIVIVVMKYLFPKH